MSGFNDLMDRAGALASKAAERAKDLAAVAAVKTRQVSRVAKLNMDVSSRKDTVKKTYAELGRLYYETHRDAPEEALAALCGQIDQAMADIAAIEEEIARIKEDAEEDADFESVVDQTAAEADADGGEEPDVIVQIVEEELHPAQPESPTETEAPAEPEAPVEPETPEEDKPAE